MWEALSMGIRKLYRTVCVNCESDAGHSEFNLEYYLLEKEILLDGFSVNTYGVEIVKCSKGKDNTICREYRKVFDIFCTQREAEDVLEKLARNTVTPVCLLDVLENMIGTGDLVNEEASFLAV